MPDGHGKAPAAAKKAKAPADTNAKKMDTSGDLEDANAQANVECVYQHSLGAPLTSV